MEYEWLKAKIWSNAWCATAASTNCTRKQSCTEYADEALRQFEIRFSHLNKPQRSGVLFMGIPVEELQGEELKMYTDHIKNQQKLRVND